MAKEKQATETKVAKEPQKPAHYRTRITIQAVSGEDVAFAERFNRCVKAGLIKL